MDLIENVHQQANNNVKYNDYFFQNISQHLMNGHIISPLSISYLMYMLYLGATNETKREIANLYGIKDYTNDVNLIKSIILIKNNINKSGIVKMENGFFINKSYEKGMKMKYLELLRKTGLIRFFTNNKIVGEINKWISNNTNGLIKGLLAESDINPLTHMVAVNTIYFKCDWLNKFKKSRTEQDVFNNSKGKVENLMFMYQSEYIHYFEDSEMQFIELPYKNMDFSFGVILSKNNNHKIYNFHNCIPQLRKQKLKIYIPKFTYKSNIDIKSIFQKMGCSLMFQKFRAQFFNIVDERTGIYIDKIIHEAVIIVDENGTEAAAATTIITQYNSISEEKIFRANHTFQFYIRHLPSGSLLFTGIFDGLNNSL